MNYTEQAQKMRPLMVEVAKTLDDDTAYDVPFMFDEWSSDSISYAINDRIRFGESLYKCVQAHISQPSWEPPLVPALWTKVPPPGVIPDWVQPTGAQDAYMKGDKVKHIEKIWESLIDNNVWEPGTVGTESLWTEVVS